MAETELPSSSLERRASLMASMSLSLSAARSSAGVVAMMLVAPEAAQVSTAGLAPD